MGSSIQVKPGTPGNVPNGCICNIFSLLFGILLIGMPVKLVLDSTFLLEMPQIDTFTISTEMRSGMGFSLDTLLTVYSIFLVFVIFCFQEINNKMREAQDRFRNWCEGRRDKIIVAGTVNEGQKVEGQNALDILRINWEYNAWLEKDLIFHLYNLKLKIAEAKARIKDGDKTVETAFKMINETACNDYHDYLYSCLLYKSKSKRNALALAILLILAGYSHSSFSFYLCIGMVMLVAYKMLSGPEFNFTNNPIAHRIMSLKARGIVNLSHLESNELKKLEEKEKELKNLVKEI